MKRFHFICFISFSIGIFAFGEENSTNYEECFYSFGKLSSSTMKRCSYKNNRMGCFWRIEKNGTARWGCVSDLTNDEKESCRPDNPDCGICYRDSCNFNNFKSPCAVCDSAYDKNCISHEKDVSLKYCDDYSDSCYTYVNRRTQEIQRGCLKEANRTIIDQCRGNQNVKSGNNDFNCVVSFLSEQLLLNTCFKCDSDIDSNCVDKPILTKEFICSSGFDRSFYRIKGCYYYKNGNRVKRGCARDLENDLSTDEYQDCTNESEKCHICNHRNCNQKNMIQQKCFKCDGNNDPKCVTGESAKMITCSNYSMSCNVAIDMDGYTHRGCSRDGICFSDYCNDFTTPPQRLRCYQCDGGSDCNELHSSIKPKPCQLKRFLMKERCYAYAADDGNMYRGCLDDHGEMSRECRLNYEKCATCSDSGCNHFNRTSIHNFLS